MLYMCVLKIFLADVTGVCQSLCRQHKFTLIYFIRIYLCFGNLFISLKSKR